ncbi:MAG: hypothetical protein ACPLQO_12725, partial [Desulfotomaculales bacterium]
NQGFRGSEAFRLSDFTAILQQSDFYYSFQPLDGILFFQVPPPQSNSYQRPPSYLVSCSRKVYNEKNELWGQLWMLWNVAWAWF